MIGIEKLNKYYNRHKKNENHVLRDLSLTLPDRGLVAIFGRSGCGKTTLLSVIGGMDRQNSGKVSYLGKSTDSDYDRYRNETVGYIFQSYLLQSEATVFENVAAALHLIGITDSETVEKRTFAALKAVGMEHYRNRLPGTLSGGQQQRVAIARAIVKNPPILLADEPTGNLDEANTIAIMELLRAISREHLVLLVTHEEKLVKRYADRIITLSDGEIESDVENVENSYDTPEDDRKIYLGDLHAETQTVGGVALHRYGEGGGEIALTLVTTGTTTYLRIDSGHVHLIDESSEICLVDGKSETKKNEKREDAAINMADLPRISGKHFGRLYSFREAFFGALHSAFGRHRRRDRALRLALIFFAIAAVFLTATFGTAIGSYRDIDSSYSHRTIYVYTPNGEIPSLLLSDEARESGTIESIRLIRHYYYVSGDEYYYFRPHAFETYRDANYYGGISTNAVLLPCSITNELRLVCGKKVDLKDNEIVLTTAAADELLSQSTAGYLDGYADLLGILLTNLYSANEAPRVVGIVESSERAIYLSDTLFAGLSWESAGFRVIPASAYGYTVEEGEVLFAAHGVTADKFPGVGKALVLKGKALVSLEIVEPPLGERQNVFLLSDKDYVDLASRIGASSACFFSGYGANETFTMDMEGEWYSVLHVKDVSKAKAYLLRTLGDDLEAPSEFSPAILYPEDIREVLSGGMEAELALGLITLAVAIALLSFSVLLLMRSTLFSRVKEIGILRAIGVSRKNLIFRFTVESAVLSMLTVFVGFLLAGGFIALSLSVTSLTSEMFFYPPWLALALLAVLLSVSILFGVLPLRRLLSPTPSEILSKYDV